MVVCLNGKIVEDDKAMVSVFDRGLHYGDGVFDTIPAAKGKILWLDKHVERFLKSCKQLHIELPWSKGDIIQFTKETFDKSERKEYEKIRILVTRGSSKDAHDTENFSGCVPTLVIFCEENKIPGKEKLENGVKLKTTKQLRPYPEIKSLNFIPSVLGQLNAKKGGFYDVLFVDENDRILEGGRFNVFVVKGGKLKTPSDGILQGVTADKVIDMARDLGIKAEKGVVTLDDVGNSDEMFATGTTKRVLPIVQVDDKKIGDGKVGPVTSKLMKRFTELYF
jgi:branched-chain amino acid aminotransferase